MARIPKWIIGVTAAISVVTVLPVRSFAQTKDESVELRKVTVANGVELHYAERGSGVPVVFVHGSLSEGGFWNEQAAQFATNGYHAIAYSRRYNPPNTNKPQPGYSAVTDGDDLAALIGALHLGRVHVIGHSYGAFAALFLAIKHPELVRSLVLCEPPAVSLLVHLSGDREEIGKKSFADIQERMVKPMKAAFQQGDREAGVRAFINYLSDDSQAWDRMPVAARQGMLSRAHEWDVMMTTGEIFPELDPRAIHKIASPVLLLHGENSFRFLSLIDEELAILVPHSHRIVIRGATHRMWFEKPEECRKDVLDFWREQSGAAQSSKQSVPHERRSMLDSNARPLWNAGRFTQSGSLSFE